jgi:ribosomal-protein-alanine N-acetyltransferase
MYGNMETNNFLLRNLDPILDDLNAYLSWMRDISQNKFIEGVRKDYSIKELQSYIVEKNSSLDAILFGIFDKEKGKHIGNIKLEPIVEKRYAWIGILIGDLAYRGKGVGFEVIAELMQFSKEVLLLQDVYLGVNKNNTTALKLYKKLGFVESLSDNSESEALHMKFNLI